MNLSRAKKVLLDLRARGVKTFILCAGARNAPFVHLLVDEFLLEGESVHHFYDERAAGFFALGRARRDHAPTAVLTTSGTAAAELLPVAVECYYSGVPIVFVTADRPKYYRGRAAPQAIEQLGLFGLYAPIHYDLDQGDEIEITRIAEQGVTHINICFDEPLLSDQMIVNEKSPQIGPEEFMRNAQRPLVVLGAIPPSVRARALEIMKMLKLPVYAEAHSGFRECDELQSLLLSVDESFFKPPNFLMYFDSVLRLGSVPTLRLWRDLETSLRDVPVLSVCERDFSGLARVHQPALSFAAFFGLLQNGKKHFTEEPNLRTSAHIWRQKTSKSLEQYPQSEPGCIRWLSENIPMNSMVFLGNSLPIREWDLAATFVNREFEIWTNRGANGIDGLISTFLGACQENKENWLILGDLSALYDLNALSFAREAAHKNVRIVVVNNSGGQIFHRMFHNDRFLNQHQLNFSKWAAMFGFDYFEVVAQSWPKFRERPTIIELRPNSEATENFWMSFELGVN